MSADLIKLIRNLGKPKVLVLGDVMLDRYIWGDAERISQEAPVILLRADKREERLGGASSVATMLVHLGADVVLAGAVGQDSDAERVRQILDGMDIDQSAVLNDPDRPTTVKERYIGRAQHKHPQQMLRVDFEDRQSLSSTLESKLIKHVQEQISSVDVVLISDYDKGVCTPQLTQAAIQAARHHRVPVLVDPVRCRPGQAPHPYEKYRGCTTMTPNRLEASLASGLPVRNFQEALQVAEELLHRYDMAASIITLDKDGMALVAAPPIYCEKINGPSSLKTSGKVDACEEAILTKSLFPTRPRHVYDITGAGDMVLSVLGMALATGADYPNAIRLANIAGGLEVEKIGVAPITREEMVADLEQSLRIEQTQNLTTKVLQIEQLQREADRLRAAGKRIAFTNGCFDILHAGHVQYLVEAKSQADLLIVGLNSDSSVNSLKGPSRPVNTQENRALVLAGLGSVDFVTIFDESTPLNLIQTLKPHVLVKGADYQRDEIVGAPQVESWGGRVHLAGIRPGCSTTGTILKMLGQPPQEANLRKVA
jgi:D-beta-D-heptose 7-phosphate kinase/D-beta-D-heptose 1-phosphate adenosyltransferase